VELNSACSTVHTQTDGLHFPLLESLLLQDADHSSVNAFSSADLPRLQTMEVHGYNPSSFPFHQLTSLSLVLDRRETRVFRLPRDFTDHLANLEHLHLEGEFNYLPNEIGCTDFEHALPKLKSLVIEVYSKPFFNLVLEHIPPACSTFHRNNYALARLASGRFYLPAHSFTASFCIDETVIEMGADYR